MPLKRMASMASVPRSCQVHPKPKPRRRSGVRRSNSAPEMFLARDRERDTTAPLGKDWRYHPRPHDVREQATSSSSGTPSPSRSNADSLDPSPESDDFFDDSTDDDDRGCQQAASSWPVLRHAETSSTAGSSEESKDESGEDRVYVAGRPGVELCRSIKEEPEPVPTRPCSESASEGRSRPPQRKVRSWFSEGLHAGEGSRRDDQKCQNNRRTSSGNLAESFTPASLGEGKRASGKGPARTGRARGGRSARLRVAAFLARFSLFAPLKVQALYNTSLTFNPPEVGYPTEITFQFTPEFNVTQGKFVRLYLGGFTSGERNGSAGPDVGFNNEFDEGNDAIVWPSDTFHGWWSEGTPEEAYADSVFNIYAVNGLHKDKPYTAILDRSSSLTSNCGHQVNDTGFFAWVDDYSGYTEFGREDFVIESVEEIPTECYAGKANLTYHPPLPKVKLQLTVAFEPARALAVGDNVTVNLKGFTSGEADGIPGRDFAMGEVLLVNNATWSAGWEEGSFVPDQPGYEESTLRLVAKTAIPAGERQEITAYKSNGFRAQCGMGENGTSSTISVQSSVYPPWTSSMEFTFSQTVGTGCLDLDYCSGRGECNYCLQTCNCLDGFGSSSDVVGREISPNCSQRVCPAGVSWASVLQGFPRPNPDDSHTLAECSSMGVCSRDLGVCQCEEGFEGRACERYACPNGCSDHGACRSMREMGLMESATPLVNDTATAASVSSDAEDFDVAYGWDSPAGTATWDARSVFGCVCDSSWEVGLGGGQTQEAEYFGADCSLLHCPSGDDPETDEDETDCSGTTARGGHGVGENGNQCHVDCSNRGLCDHATGLCNCFDGYHGQACNMKQVDGYGFNTDGL